MALTLAARVCGDEVARHIALALEYAPEPPSAAAGSPHTAAPQLVARMRDGYARSHG
jgi:cyclohexyl-isocyanide hydratase